jgi:ribosomal protein L11 methyltransferase
MFWRILIHTTIDLAPAFEEALEPHVLAVSWFETKDPDLWVVEGTTKEKPNHQLLQATLSSIAKLMGVEEPKVIIEELPETDWLEATWRSFPPREIGRFYVYGSHHAHSPIPEDKIGLEINAATAFGSGEHETTTGCLLTIDELVVQAHTFSKPLDMGCGSGILAMAMAKVWGAPVLAADIDPESVRVTQENAKINHCDHLIEACVSEGFQSGYITEKAPFDIVTANILAKPLCDMADDLVKSIMPGGYIILSGLLSRHREDVVATYERAGAQFVSQKVINDWVALLMKIPQG